MKRFGLALLLLGATGTGGQAMEGGQPRGKALLETMCSRCHATGTTGSSPHPDAPPFRTFGDDKLYDNDFAQRLQTGLSTIHPDMPTFHFSREDAEAVVDYLRSIQLPHKSNQRR
jgi:mono/diheme cytochrome c family protein